MVIASQHLLPFLAVAIALVVAPGPDFVMTTRNVLRGGRGSGILTGLGVATGTLVWTAASVLGIAAILRISTVAFTAVKLAGAAYLVYLGGHALVSAIAARRQNGVQPSVSDPVQNRARSPLAGKTAYRQGLVCNLLNPKAAAIFTSILPQFVVAGRTADMQLAELGVVMVLLAALWLSLYSVVADALRNFFGSRAKRVVEAITGSVLIGFGIRLATE